MKFQVILVVFVVLALGAIAFFAVDAFRTMPSGPARRQNAGARIFKTWPCDTEASGVHVALDDEGNIFVVGTFTESPSPNQVRDSKGRPYPQASLVRMNETGAQAWILTWPGSPQDISVDKNGNIYVIGLFEGIVDFNPGEGNARRGTEDARMVFLSKFNRLGEFQWVRTWGESRVNVAARLAVDDFGGVSVGGTFARIADAAPSRGWNATVTGARHNIFIHKFDSSGNTQWRFTGSGYDFGSLMAIDADRENNVYISGCMLGESGAEALPPRANEQVSGCRCGNVFVMKFNQTGNQLWTGSWPDGTGTILSADLAVDPSGRIYLSGDFSGDIQSGWTSGAPPAPASSVPGAFVACIGQSGENLWLKTWGGSREGHATGIETGPAGDVYVVGYYLGSASIRIGDTARDLVSKGSGPDAFIATLSPEGEFKYAHSWGGNGSEYAYGVAVDKNGCAFVTGEYHGMSSADFADSAHLAMRNGAYLIELRPEGN